MRASFGVPSSIPRARASVTLVLRGPRHREQPSPPPVYIVLVPNPAIPDTARRLQHRPAASVRNIPLPGLTSLEEFLPALALSVRHITLPKTIALV